MALLFKIDASDPTSYSGTGSIWYDISGNGKHVTLNGSPTWDSRGWFRFYNSSSSFGQFDSTGFPTGSASRTASVWVKRKSSANYSGYAFAYGNGANSQLAAIGMEGNQFYAAGYIANAYAGTVQEDIWYNLHYTYDGSLLKLYVNGILKDSKSVSWNTVLTSYGYIGKLNFSPYYYFDGEIAKVSFYDVAFDSTQILNDYSSNFSSSFLTQYNSLYSGLSLGVTRCSKNLVTPRVFITSQQSSGSITPPFSGTNPQISIVSPPTGSSISRYDTITFDVTDDLPFRRIMIAASFSGSDVREVIHDGDSFSNRYSREENTRSSISGGYRYTILRNNGWTMNPILTPYAIDVSGSEND